MIVKVAVVFAALSGALAVTLGAFGAHGLRGKIEPRLMETFQTAVEYQMIHSVALLMVALMISHFGRTLALDISIYAFIGGIILFSGSLYGLALTELRWLGPVTPLGGLFFITGWLALAVGGLQQIE